ncbi:MAG TPA: hypothetical protein VN461_24045 [Vicinamibacteria bacterium]|nr:hypothetical protein [Vicinamibacteria bacterium]
MLTRSYEGESLGAVPLVVEYGNVLPANNLEGRIGGKRFEKRLDPTHVWYAPRIDKRNPLVPSGPDRGIASAAGEGRSDFQSYHTARRVAPGFFGSAVLRTAVGNDDFFRGMGLIEKAVEQGHNRLRLVSSWDGYRHGKA